jgi:hypothetical protein
MVSTTLVLPADSDRAWRAVLHVLGNAFPQDARVWKYVLMGDTWTIHFDAMLEAGTWSGSEKILLKGVASLFLPGYEVSLWELAHELSEDNWRVFLEALSILRKDIYICT